MSDPVSEANLADPFGLLVKERVSVRAAYLRREVERELEGTFDKLRLILALEEIEARLQSGDEINSEHARWLFCATGVSDESVAIGAHYANGRLRLEGRAQDAFLPEMPSPDEARVLQVLLRLQELPRYSGKDVTSALERVIQISALPKSEGQQP